MLLQISTSKKCSFNLFISTKSIHILTSSSLLQIARKKTPPPPELEIDDRSSGFVHHQPLSYAIKATIKIPTSMPPSNNRHHGPYPHQHHQPTVDGRNPAPPQIYIFLPNNGINYISTGDRRISEPSTPINLFPLTFPGVVQEIFLVDTKTEGFAPWMEALKPPSSGQVGIGVGPITHLELAIQGALRNPTSCDTSPIPMLVGMMISYFRVFFQSSCFNFLGMP